MKRPLAFALALVGLSGAAVAQPPLLPSRRLAVQTEGALGVAGGAFYNQLLGARLDFRFSPAVSLGAYLGYANLKGKEGRAHALLPCVQLEYAAPLAPRLRAPLRFGTGYLPRNGPLARVAAGLAFALAPSVDLVAELFAPTVWVTSNRALLSMSLALELAMKL